MSWLPIGPDFVFAPKNSNFKRLSCRNELGAQGSTINIAVDPTDPSTIYIAEENFNQVATAFRTLNDGASWIPISDDLQQSDPIVYPTCIAVNPDHPETIYMGSGNSSGIWGNCGVYVSSNRGEVGSWSDKYKIPGCVRKLIVDPRTSSVLATTILYAATDNGIYRSQDGAQTWALIQPGDCLTLAAWMPNDGTVHFFAGIRQQGVFYTNDPTSAWTNLNAMGIGLPAHSGSIPASDFSDVMVDFCRLNPTRAYVVFKLPYPDRFDAAVFTTDSPRTLWTKPRDSFTPSLSGRDVWSFGVAPNSPGDGANDVLILGSLNLQRSIDGGHTWELDLTHSFHPDQRSIAFSPEVPELGKIPATYIGCDGGIAKSTKFSDPTVSITDPPLDFNEGLKTADTFIWQNKNHGKQSSAVIGYASHQAMPALSYIGCQDTGIAAGDTALGWREVSCGIGDAFAIAAAPATNGVAVWMQYWAEGQQIGCLLDQGNFAPSFFVAAKLSGSLLFSSSNLAVSLDNKCLAGVAVNGVNMVVRIDENGEATQISQQFETAVNFVTVHPTDPNILYCITGISTLWMTNEGADAGLGTVWTQVVADKPDSYNIYSIAITPGGNVYVWIDPKIIGGQVPIYLFEVSTGRWIPQQCDGFPASHSATSKFIADPVQANILYINSSNKIFSLALVSDVWTYTDISDGLPGPLIYDLWIGTIGTGADTKVLLRAAIPTRGVWEREVTAGVVDSVISLYIRNNFLDQGWLNSSPDGVVNPYNPSTSLLHSMCADVKIDAQQINTISGQPDFFQTDPEGNPIPPLNHVLFDQLNDMSQNLSQNRATFVHVQVHNRSAFPADNVWVWAIYCKASSGIPLLSDNFWAQFSDAGINPVLPSGSPWTSIGEPQQLFGITASTPQVASWRWTIPLLPPGDPGEYSMVILVHSATSPIGETARTDVDAITQTNKQVGQKTLSIMRYTRPSPPSNLRMQN